MSIYYITDRDGGIYELDATTQITYTETGTITDNVIESGDTVSDHYVNKPVTISFSGTITDVKSFSSDNAMARTTEDYINGLIAIKNEKQLISFFFGNKLGTVLNCVITNLSFTQNNRNGNIAGDIDSFSVSGTLRQVRLAERALVTSFRDPLFRDNAQEQVQGKGSTEENTNVSATQEALDLIRSGVSDIRGG